MWYLKHSSSWMFWISSGMMRLTQMWETFHVDDETSQTKKRVIYDEASHSEWGVPRENRRADKTLIKMSQMDRGISVETSQVRMGRRMPRNTTNCVLETLWQKLSTRMRHLNISHHDRFRFQYSLYTFPQKYALHIKT